MSPKKRASKHGKNEILSRAMFVCSETIHVPPKKPEPFRTDYPQLSRHPLMSIVSFRLHCISSYRPNPLSKLQSSHTPFLPLQHHVAQQCMRHIAHLFKISSSSVSYFYITLPTSPNTFSSYPIALNFPSATSASAAPRPCHRPGFQPPPSTRPTSFPTHTDKGI